ncbi:MAG: ferredoxin-type protein NapF [Gammaproteobacteria bacterium]|nr:ferredoxin-type protein NapF [Gammaproteobacteria bacterium]
MQTTPTASPISRRNLFRGHFAAAERAPLRPPWSLSETEFIARCERCDECVKVCENHILVRGDGGFPSVDFSLGSCSFCAKCVAVCKPQALHHGSDTPWHYQATINKSCLSLQGITCRSCGDGCEPRALRFRLATGGRAEPLINTTLCNGCGDCFYRCPVKAITMQSSETLSQSA